MSDGGFSYNNNSNPPNPWDQGGASKAPGPSPSASGGDSDTMALIALGSGIGSVVSMFCCCLPFIGGYLFWLQPILAVAALVMGFIAIKDTRLDSEHQTYAKVAMVLGGVSLIFFVIAMIVVMLAFVGIFTLPVLVPLLEQMS
ncbi:MAG: hypothetical protein AAFS10_15475 [Myxococcota bacterium]